MRLGQVLRRPAVAGSAAAIMGVGLCLWGGQHFAKLKVANTLEKRLKTRVSIQSLSLGWSQHDAFGVRVGGQSAAYDVQVKHVRIHASPFGLLSSGRRGIERIEIDGAEVSMNVHRLKPHHVDREHEAARTSQRNNAATWLPKVVARNLRLKLVDQDGSWVSGDCAELALTNHHLKLMGATGELSDGAAHVTVSDVAIEAERTKAGVQLSGGHVEHIKLEGHPDQGPVWALERTRRAVSTIRNAWLGQSKSSSPDADDSDSDTPKWSRWLAAGAAMDVQRADLDWIYGGSTEPLLQNATLTIGSPSQGRITSHGHGTAASGGSIKWDAVVGTRPFAVRADVQVDNLPLTLLEGAVPQLPWLPTEDGKISANLRLRTQSPRQVSWEGVLTVDNAALSSPRIAPEPVTQIHVALHGKGMLLPYDRAIQIDEGRLRVGDAEVEITGLASVNSPNYKLNVDLQLPVTNCALVMQAIPPTLLGDLRTARLGGKISGTINLRLDSQALQDTVLEFKVRDRCEFVNMTSMADLRRFRMPFTHSVIEPDDSIFQMETGPGSSNYTYLEDISPFFVNAVLAHEDARFFSHGGFSPPHIRDALVRNLQEGRYVVGASTISMQLVKNLLLHREKTLARKLQEVLLTWYMERTIDKRDILELYLNVIEYGPSIYGIGRASRHYFGRLPSQLSPAEGAFLATILPNPKRYHDYYERGALSSSGAERVRALLRRLGERGSCDEATVAYGLAEVDHFRFVKEGELPAPRTLEGKCSPLPYQTGFETRDVWDLLPTNQVYDQAAQFP